MLLVIAVAVFDAPTASEEVAAFCAAAVATAVRPYDFARNRTRQGFVSGGSGEARVPPETDRQTDRRRKKEEGRRKKKEGGGRRRRETRLLLGYQML